MEVLGHIQSFVQEHAFTIGVGLLVASVIAAAVWFWMSRGSKGESKVLENQARVNEVYMDKEAMPPNSMDEAPMAPPPMMQPQPQVGDESSNE